jgi:hypothetical protein
VTKRFVCSLAVLAVLLGSTGGARAEPILWDYSPGGLGIPITEGPAVLQNQATQQNLADRIFFTSPVGITGMDIYGGGNSPPHVGDSATIRLYGDASGQPGQLLTSFTAPLTAVDSIGAENTRVLRLHADFTNPLNLQANTTYWIGMSGTSTDFGQAGLSTPPARGGDHRMAYFDGLQFKFVSLSPWGDMAFRLEGSVRPTPEPSSLALLTLGAAGLAGHAWRKRRRN